MWFQIRTDNKLSPIICYENVEHCKSLIACFSMVCFLIEHFSIDQNGISFLNCLFFNRTFLNWSKWYLCNLYAIVRLNLKAKRKFSLYKLSKLWSTNYRVILRYSLSTENYVLSSHINSKVYSSNTIYKSRSF